MIGNMVDTGQYNKYFGEPSTLKLLISLSMVARKIIHDLHDIEDP